MAIGNLNVYVQACRKVDTTLFADEALFASCGCAAPVQEPGLPGRNDHDNALFGDSFRDFFREKWKRHIVSRRLQLTRLPLHGQMEAGITNALRFATLGIEDRIRMIEVQKPDLVSIRLRQS